MELMRNTGGEERELLGLMKVFKSYYPDIIIGDTYASTGRATYFFKHPDPEWVKQMRHVQERTAAAGMTNPGQNVPQTFQVVRRGEVKRSRIEVVIPVVQTSRVKSDFTSLEEIRSANDFVQKLDRIEMPNQVAAALADPLAQRYLVFVRNEGATRRLESWLDSFFEDEVARIQAREEGDDEGNDPEHLEYVLDVLIGFVRFTKVGLLSFSSSSSFLELFILTPFSRRACLKLWISFCASTSSPGTVMTAELPSCRSWSIYPYRTTIPFDKITSFH